ncbi:MAG TPA: AraC family transcriptional regulator [Caulobacterales bacterium]|nr:AraC family transcriptional regulator [Caulobacterales bacterium]
MLSVAKRRDAPNSPSMTQREAWWPLSPRSGENASPLHCVREDQCAADPAASPRGWVYREASIGFVVSGCFEYHGEAGSVLGAPGLALFGNAGEHFHARHLDDRGNTRLVVCVDHAVLEEAAAALGLDEARFPALALPPSRSTTAMFGLMRRLSLERDADLESIYGLVGAALAAMHPGAEDERVSPRDRRRLLPVVRHIEAHYDEACGLDLLAGLSGLSRFHFVRAFHRATGQSPNQFVINTRLRAAADMLLMNDAAITEVALTVGFNDVSHFYSCFRSAFGCTPRQWRLRRAR